MYFKKWKDFIVVNEEVNNTTNSQQGTNSTINTPKTNNTQQGTNGNKQEETSQLGGDKLQKYLNEWNSAYSQSFKFLNNMPKQVGNTNTLEQLLSNIPDEYKALVSTGITKLVDAFKNGKVANAFNGKELLIIGYTSTTASDSYNQALSLRRAKIVANAIRSVIVKNNLKLNIKFKEEGMGENPAGLIIVNDNDLNPVQLGKNAPQLDNDTLEKIKNNKEERQKLNRRVKITLPEFKFNEVPFDVKITEEPKEEALIEKPELPKPDSVQFNLNSFILTKESQSILVTFCNELKNFNQSTKDENKKVKNVYISSHVMRKEEENNERKSKDEKIKDEFLTRLSLNRAKLVKDFIIKSLGENHGVKFYIYPVAFKMGNTEKKVVINFEKGEHMKKAEQVSKDLMNQYGIKFGNFGVDTPTYDDNNALTERTFYNIKQTMDAHEISKWVPIELFYDNLEGYYGLSFYKTQRAKFKEEFKNLINKKKKNIEDIEEYMQQWVYDPE